MTCTKKSMHTMLCVASHTSIHRIQIHMSVMSFLGSPEAADDVSETESSSNDSATSETWSPAQHRRLQATYYTYYSSNSRDQSRSAKWEDDRRCYYRNRIYSKDYTNRRQTPYIRPSPYTGGGSGGTAWRSVGGADRTHHVQRQRDLNVKFQALDVTWEQRDLDISIGLSDYSRDWDVIDRECTCRATWKIWMCKFRLRQDYQDYAHFRWIWMKKDLHMLGPIEVDTMMRAIGSHVFDAFQVPEVYSRSISLNRG